MGQRADCMGGACDRIYIVLLGLNFCCLGSYIIAGIAGW